MGEQVLLKPGNPYVLYQSNSIISSSVGVAADVNRN